MAYNEVQTRREDLRRMERTLGELAQLFNDVSLREIVHSTVS